MTSEAREQAYNDYQAAIHDPACCEICGGWLGDEERAPVGRAHLNCYQEVIFESMGGYDQLEASS